jgi:hypothetical protein
MSSAHLNRDNIFPHPRLLVQREPETAQAQSGHHMGEEDEPILARGPEANRGAKFSLTDHLNGGAAGEAKPAVSEVL